MWPTNAALGYVGISSKALKTSVQTKPCTQAFTAALFTKVRRWNNPNVHLIDKHLIYLYSVKVTQSCPTLCIPTDCSPPGFSVHGILQARILEWVAFPSPGDLPNPGVEPSSSALQADSIPSEPPGKPPVYLYNGILFIHKKELSSEIHYNMMNLKHTVSDRSQSQKTSYYDSIYLESENPLK